MASPIAPPEPGPAGRAAGLLICAAAALTFLDQLAPGQGFALAGFVAITLFILLCGRSLGPLAFFLLTASAAGTATFVATGHDLAEFAAIAGRCVYLPALIAVLVPLRLIAMQAPLVERAGQFVVDQPPGRRYAFLTLAAQIFGVLLNIGGLLLLAHVALRDLLARDAADRDVAVQTRRISTAVLRGFAATMFWSPLGLGLNLVLTLVPGASWITFLPYGTAAAALFLSLGWLLDRVVHPSPSSIGSGQDRPRRGDPSAVAALVALLLSISALASLPELAFDLSFRGGLLLVVPLFALGWRMIDRPTPVPKRVAAMSLLTSSLAEMPRRANETVVIFAASYLGMVVAAVIPNAAVVGLAGSMGLSGPALAIAICLTVFVTSALGLSPLVPATICVAVVISAGLAIAPELLILSTLTGWALAVLVSPATASVTILAGVANQTALRVGLIWNSLFCAMVLGVALSAFLMIWG